MTDNSPYPLNESTEDGVKQENERLDFQHDFLCDVMNNELLPRHITDQLAANPSPRVCELATGSAVWLREIAKTLPPSAELVGLDFDTTKFPKPEVLPTNIRLEFGDAYKPFPEELRGRFDVVHLRHFALATKKDHGVALAQNFLSLLRPGGWLVWVEAGGSLANSEPPSEAIFQFQTLYHHFLGAAGLDTGMPLAMTSYMRQTGLVDCDDRGYNSGSILFGPKGSDWPARERHEFTITMNQILKGIVNMGCVEGMQTQEDFEKFQVKLRSDMSVARRYHLPVIRAWGRKPS